MVRTPFSSQLTPITAISAQCPQRLRGSRRRTMAEIGGARPHRPHQEAAGEGALSTAMDNRTLMGTLHLGQRRTTVWQASTRSIRQTAPSDSAAMGRATFT